MHLSVFLFFFGPSVFFLDRFFPPALAVHCSASVSLSFFVFEEWECWTYWVIFAICRLVCLSVSVLEKLVIEPLNTLK